jgi:hypothetical protein
MVAKPLAPEPMPAAAWFDQVEFGGHDRSLIPTGGKTHI